MTDVRFTEFPRTGVAAVDRALHNLARLLGEYDDEVQAALALKSGTTHDHDDAYYTEAEADALLADKSDTGHIHDGRYYTEAEIDALLDAKQALHALLTDIAALSPSLGSVIWYDGSNLQVITPTPGADRTLQWNDTTNVVEWI